MIEVKNKLHSEGYCQFQLSDFDKDAFEMVKKLEYKSNDKKYIENFKNLRFNYISDNDVDNFSYSDSFSSFAECDKKKYELLEKYDENGIAQIWLYRDINFSDDDFIKNINKIFYNILEYFYNKTDKDVNFGIQWTLYNKDCFLKDHNDGQGDKYQNTCAILIYLNEEWNEEWGGNLILRNTKNTNDTSVAHKVIPKFGTVAIIDLEKFDTSHAVEKIIGDHNRFTILAFATSKTKREKKKINII